MAVQWPLLIFSVLLGASSGILIFLGIGELKGAFKKVRFPLALAALVLLVVGGCASAMHLGNIDRALHILGNLNSGLSKELFGVGFAFVITLAYLILAKKDYPGASKVFGVLGLIAGIALPLIAGASYMMPARPVWDTFTLPLMYLGTGLGLGFVLACAIVCTRGDETDTPFALRLALAGVIISAVTVLAYVAWIAFAPYQATHRSIARLVSGSLAAEFWIGTVIIGMVAPIALTFMAAKKALSGNSTMTVVSDDEDMVTAGGTVAGAAAVEVSVSGVKQAAGWLWATLACLAVGSVMIRVIMYLMASSVESFIY